MILENNQIELEQKQKLLERHRRNLSYLKQQAVQHGLDVPLALHNSLADEREKIARLERELAASGVSSQSKPDWQALIIDADSHWRKIVVNNINKLGGAVIELDAQPRPEVIETCAVAIVGVSGHSLTEPSTRQWIKDMVKLGRSLPVILLASWEDRDITIALRRAFLNDDKDITVTTIFKETLDLHWFSRIIHQILTR